MILQARIELAAAPGLAAAIGEGAHLIGASGHDDISGLGSRALRENLTSTIVPRHIYGHLVLFRDGAWETLRLIRRRRADLRPLDAIMDAITWQLMVEREKADLEPAAAFILRRASCIALFQTKEERAGRAILMPVPRLSAHDLIEEVEAAKRDYNLRFEEETQ